MATPLTDLQDKVLTFVADAEKPAVDYVTKASEALAARLPDDRNERVEQGIALALEQVDFAKKLLDTQVDFVKSVLDAATKPFKPAPVKAARATKAA